MSHAVQHTLKTIWTQKWQELSLINTNELKRVLDKVFYKSLADRLYLSLKIESDFCGLYFLSPYHF